MIRFSIITVCLNAGEDLIATVTDTLRQTYENFEIIVKDGFSTDGSVEKLPADDRIRLVQKKDTGIYDAMNQAVLEATGDYLIFMNAGDWFYDNRVLADIASIIESTRAPLYYGRCFDRQTGQVRVYPSRFTRMSCYRTMICHQATVYRADIFAEHPYDLSYRILADRELLWYLVCGKGVSPVYIDRVIANYQGAGESASEKHKARNAADQQRLMDTYMPKWEQRKYALLMALTFQKARVKLSQSPKYSGAYYQTIRRLYTWKDALSGKKNRKKENNP